MDSSLQNKKRQVGSKVTTTQPILLPKRQEGSRRLKKVQAGSRRLKKAQEGLRRFNKV